MQTIPLGDTFTERLNSSSLNSGPSFRFSALLLHLARCDLRKRPFLPIAATYNQVGGQSAERLAAPSDGISAVAMTLLVLDFIVPVAEAIHSSY
jgi:hypothetical protein